MIGQTVSHYRIIEKLGEGGMGVVYVAEDAHLARRVAIKFLSSLDHHYRARFIREARAVSSLNHPNIALVYDYGETLEGTPFIVMELVLGRPLSEHLEEGLTQARSVEIVSSIAEALGEAHENGIVHRDMKPSNVVITEKGQVKVLDFGLVKHLFEQSSNSANQDDAETIYSTQTRSDVIVGTPLYLSPEQAKGKPVDGRSDLFALGSLLYECLTGHSAFSGSSVLEIGAQVIHVNPLPPSQLNPEVPAELDRITLKALEKKVEDRYQSAFELLADLRAIKPHLSGEGRPAAIRNNQTPIGGTRRSSALHTFTTSMRKQRFSLTALIAVVAFTAVAIWAVIHWWPRSYYLPPAAALVWYDRGTDALRNGAYFQASKALEQAIAIDNRYALAHARLAQAWAELDYTDKAKDELLTTTGLVGDRSSLSPKDALYLDATTAGIRRDFAAAVKAYSGIAELSPEDPQVYVDLGYAYENNGDVDKALESYHKAINLNSGQYATAFLRAGIVYNRKLDAAKATEYFNKAEELYRAASNSEGVNEVLRQRGVLFRESGKYDDARTQFQHSLDAARAIGNEAQQISALIELSYLASTRGSTAEAEDFATQAIAFAQDKHLENLAAGGLLELGNSFSSRGDYTSAEKYFKQAIEFARANKGRMREARGLSNLGGMYIQLLRVDEGLPMVQQALTFFQENNYPKNVAFCLTHISRGYRRKGDYDTALKALNQKLQIAQQGGSQPAIADCDMEIGAVLFDQESLPQALGKYDQAHQIYQAVGNKGRTIYSQANRANILWRLGRYDESREALNEAVSAVEQSPGNFKQLVPVLHLVAAQISLSERNFADAIAKSNEAISLAGKDYPDVAIEAKFTLGLVKALAGSGKEGRTLCEEAVRMANDASDIALLSRAMLSQAEASLQSGDAQEAWNLATQAQEKFATGSRLESEWRAWLIAARASQQLGDKGKAEELMGQSMNARSQLEQNWGGEAFKGYVSRPDIQAYYKGLN
jgi:tetratricopeptide (TPR) repeat protein/predicted Ser/Thr protein kinase